MDASVRSFNKVPSWRAERERPTRKLTVFRYHCHCSFSSPSRRAVIAPIRFMRENDTRRYFNFCLMQWRWIGNSLFRSIFQLLRKQRSFLEGGIYCQFFPVKLKKLHVWNSSSLKFENQSCTFVDESLVVRKLNSEHWKGAADRSSKKIKWLKLIIFQNIGSKHSDPRPDNAVWNNIFESFEAATRPLVYRIPITIN